MTARSREPRKLTRSPQGVVAGVCGGLAEYFGIDPSLVRVGYAALMIFSVGFPGMLLYIIMWAIVPKRRFYE